MDRIPPREYVFWVVSKDKKSDCPHMIELVGLLFSTLLVVMVVIVVLAFNYSFFFFLDHFNWLSNWVTTEIVTRIHLADRTKLFVQLIEVPYFILFYFILFYYILLFSFLFFSFLFFSFLFFSFLFVSFLFFSFIYLFSILAFYSFHFAKIFLIISICFRTSSLFFPNSKNTKQQ